MLSKLLKRITIATIVALVILIAGGILIYSINFIHHEVTGTYILSQLLSFYFAFDAIFAVVMFVFVLFLGTGRNRNTSR